MNLDRSFGDFVRQHRREMDLTQEELARRVGCAAITLRKIEANDLRASVQIAERLAMALAIPIPERTEFVRQARAVRPESGDVPQVTPPPAVEEIGRDDLTGRAIRGYALAERIGVGGMGSVYRAVQPHVEREVAVKIILPAFANHPDFIRRFEAEAQLVARLEHPHIVPLYDYWREPGVAYLVMRLLRGGNIQTQLGYGPLSVETTAHVLDQICSALHAAHHIGIIHRDLKPANVLLDEYNNAYLADFGIAKNLGNPDSENLPQVVTGMIGSPQYMSPEQILSMSVSPQTDIYCLGVMIYEMLTGSLPFPGPTPFDLIQQQIYAPMPPLAARQTGLPAGLDAVIERATAKDSSKRHEDALELLKDFRHALGRSSGMHPVVINFEVDEEPENTLVNPFIGLRAFSEADAENFFGREALIQQLLARLGEGGDLSRFLAVIGPSGSGKSSVVRAGLIPALRRGGLPNSENWFIVDLLPGKHPFEELEAALLRVAVNPPQSLLTQLKDGKRGLLRAVRRILPADNLVELVLFIDQFEEVFTLIEDENERTLLLESLATAVMDERSRLHIIITLRADFTDKPLRYVDFGEMLNRRFEFVLPLNSDEAERAVAGPAQRAGLKLEKGLISTIIRETGNQPGALPLLQYALSELFEKREGRTLTNKAYREIGGVLGALGRSADMIFSRLDQAGQSSARQAFLRLITLGEGTQDTRRRILRSELESLAIGTGSLNFLGETGTNKNPLSIVLDAFGKAHLLTFDRDPLTRGATIEVAHEALLHEWKRLRNWLDESRADVRQQRQLAAFASEWRAARQDASFLLTGARLEQFEGWFATTTLELTHDERIFLEASGNEHRRRTEEERLRKQRELENIQKLAQTERARAEDQSRSLKKLRYRAVWLGISLVIALIAAISAGFFAQRNRQLADQNAFIASTSQAAEAIAVQERNLAEQQALFTSVRELSGEANANLEIDPERSILLALHAVRKTASLDGTVLPEAEDALHRAVQAARIELTLKGHKESVWMAAFSSDGKLIATAGLDNAAIIWDANTGKELISLPASFERGVNAVAFNPDGKFLATAGGDKIARIWDVTSGKQVLTLKGHLERVYYVAYSRDGLRLATCSLDGVTKIWDANTGAELYSLSEARGVQTLMVDFSPNGKQVVTANSDFAKGWATVWDLDSGEKIFSLPGNATYVRSAHFSPTGNTIITSGDDQTAKLWDASTGQKLLTFYGHTDSVSYAAFSPNGEWLATSSYDRHAKIWEVATGRELMDLAGHERDLTSVAFSPDGQRIVTSSVDMTSRVWSVAPSRELLTLVNGPAIGFTEGSELSYSPDGSHLVVANSDLQPKVWDTKTGWLSFSLVGHTGDVTFATYNADGSQIATASNDGTAKVWDAASGKDLMTFSGHTDFVFGAAFSPDGTKLATTSFDKTAKIWDIATGKLLTTLNGHKDWVFSAVFSPDGKHLATSSIDTTVIIWDWANRKPLLTLWGHKDLVDQVVYSPDGTRLATASFDGTAKVWDAATGKELFTLGSHVASVFDVAFSWDNKLIATASADKTAKIWDAATGKELLTLHAAGPLSGVAFSPDGSQLAAAGRDGTTRIYLLRIQDLIALAKSRLTRTWTPEECQKYLHADSCPLEP